MGLNMGIRVSSWSNGDWPYDSPASRSMLELDTEVLDSMLVMEPVREWLADRGVLPPPPFSLQGDSRCLAFSSASSCLQTEQLSQMWGCHSHCLQTYMLGVTPTSWRCHLNCMFFATCGDVTPNSYFATYGGVTPTLCFATRGGITPTFYVNTCRGVITCSVLGSHDLSVFPGISLYKLLSTRRLGTKYRH